MTALEEMIARHPFLSALHPLSLPFFFHSASFERHGAGDLIFREGESAAHFYLIHSGQLTLETFVPGLGNLIIQTLGAGDALGWSWLFSPFVWHFTARASEATELIAFDAADLRQKAEDNPVFGRDLGLRISKILLQRLQSTRLQLLDFYALGT